MKLTRHHSWSFTNQMLLCNFYVKRKLSLMDVKAFLRAPVRKETFLKLIIKLTSGLTDSCCSSPTYEVAWEFANAEPFKVLGDTMLKYYFLTEIITCISIHGNHSLITDLCFVT